MRVILQSAAIAVAVLSAPLVAQETLGSGGGYGRGGGMMRMADANGDGVITRDEWLAASDARFARMDANGDGVLQYSERPMRRGRPGGPVGGPPPEGGKHRADMTRAQFREDALRRFDRLDTNHDGKIDQQERAAAATLTRFRAGPNARGDDAPPPPPPSE